MIVRVTGVFAATLAAAAILGVAQGDTAGGSSVTDGVFSEAQAIRGQEIYFTYCYLCHGDDMSGRDQAPPLAGPQFSGVWEDASLWSLVDRFGTMPPDRPGILSRDEAVDLLSYVLWFNGLPLGETELGTDKDLLESMTFETPLPGQ